jgi:hypothetical protein
MASFFVEITSFCILLTVPGHHSERIEYIAARFEGAPLLSGRGEEIVDRRLA